MSKKENKTNNEEKMTFWEHVEVFRKVIFRCLAIWLLCAIAAFVFKDGVFRILFAPSKSDFILYDILCFISHKTNVEVLCPGYFEIDFINTQLASQFMTHLSVSLWLGVVAAMPYLIYQLYGFVSPALYDNEKRYSYYLIFCSVILFACGVLLNYFVIFPFSFRFLSTYQVSSEVVNQIALSSYISTFFMLSLMIGIIFEIPILAFFLAKLDLINAEIMRKYRKHAFVVICIIAAIITPTADIFTLMLVALPIAFLYELSIAIVKRTQKHNSKPMMDHK